MSTISPITAPKKGFTLIEILVTFVIMSILLVIGVFSYNVYLMKGRDQRRKADLAYVQEGIEQYKANDINGSYPSTGNYAGLCSLAPAYIAKLPWDPLSTDPCASGGIG